MQMPGQYFGMSYTRNDEAQADQLGFQFYAHAGWDPAKRADKETFIAAHPL